MDEDEEGASDIESRIEVDALLTSMKRSLNFSIRSNVTTSTASAKARAAFVSSYGAVVSAAETSLAGASASGL